MTDKEPMLLVVLVETAKLRWYVAGVGAAGSVLPLLRSEPGNLQPYLWVPFDEQVNFLRHRLSGVLQRGCDRLWGREKKPSHIVFLTDGPFKHAPAELASRVAEHFVEWMNRPPVAFFMTDSFVQAGQKSLEKVAGNLEEMHLKNLAAALPPLLGALADDSDWELVPTKKPTA